MTEIRFSNIKKETFKNEVCRLLNERGYKTKVTVFPGFDETEPPCEGLSVYREGDVVTPSVNLNALYYSYTKSNETGLQDGCICTIEEVVGFILENIEESKHKNGLPDEKVIFDILNNWDIAKDRMVICLYGLETKREYVKNTVHKIIAENLVIIPYVQLNDIDSACAITVPVTNNMQSQWGLTTEEILETAKKSSAKIRPVDIVNINEMQKQAMIDEGVPDFLINEMCNPDIAPEMYAVTCTNRNHGAAALFYNGIMEKLYDSFGAFYVLPSSDAELIIISKDVADKFGLDVESLQKQVLDVNQTDGLFESAEILTDSVYFYDDTCGFRKIC